MIRASSGLTMALSVLFLASCAPSAASVPTPQAPPTATSTPHAQEIRFGLIGEVTHPNIWTLFDEIGQSYNNYAVESGYWPRLYRLSIPDGQFQPEAALGMPSVIQQEGNFFTGTVPLRADLKWSDGSAFTADDVVFTINTVLSFQLGFDWRSFYDPAWLDHVEAVNEHTVKFYFKKVPDVAIWQYGILQGPIVNKTYWTSKVAASNTLLPPTDLAAQIEDLKVKIFTLQAQANASNGTSAAMANSEEGRQTQGDLDQAINDLAKAQSSYNTSMNAARQSLYALSENNEPHLGTWQAGDLVNGLIENKANLSFYFDHPHFDNVVYHIYPSEDAALQALQAGDVDVILTPDGISPESSIRLSSSIKMMNNPTSSARFLVINENNPTLQSVAVRQALACVIDSEALTQELNSQAMPLESFVLPGNRSWYDAAAALPCKGMDDTHRLAQAVQILSSAGFAWDNKPTDTVAGQGLRTPAGGAFPSLELLAPASDPLRAAAANYVQKQARLLGIPLAVRLVAPDAINYAVFSSHQFDLAILGWRLSSYPGYLCDWLGNGNPFRFNETDVTSRCGVLAGTSDIGVAHKAVFDIQTLLNQDLPFIPLYAGAIKEAYQNVSYPFDQVLDGLNGLYGAPSLAMPAP